MLLLSACGAVASGSTAASPSPSLLNEWKPQVAVVFAQVPPGKEKNRAQSYAVNVSVWPTNKVLCDKPPNPRVSLYVSKNNQPGDFLAKDATPTSHQANGVTFPSAEFNDVPASLAADPGARFSFVVYIRGHPASNVWLHGSDKSEPYAPVKPAGYASPDPAALDTIIQIVFPHDARAQEAPADKATALNIAVDVFQHGTDLSVPPDADYKPQLWMSQGGAELQALPNVAVRTIYTERGQGYPRWVFNDVQVQPGQHYHFLATIGQTGMHGGSYPSIWTHGSGKTEAFKPNPPPGCIP